ncbi:PEP-CTERM sorting domain-containing protein [Pontiellaceae bacterium B1224]|nr:PEP-CTERM sorting domain-containing protein [Pontiellaceae bacterium B1224]
MKNQISIALGAVLLSASVASAAIIPMPDMSGGGTFTLNEGDTWTNSANTTVGGQGNTAVININGDWTSAEAFEVALGGVNLDANTDFTLNIGATGSVDISKLWMSVTDNDNNITATINIATGGTYGRATTGQFTRYRYPGNDWNNTVERLWDDGALLRDGANVGTFAENFSVVGDVAGVYTITAIPEPATLGLIGAFGGAILFIRRRFTI